MYKYRSLEPSCKAGLQCQYNHGRPLWAKKKVSVCNSPHRSQGQIDRIAPDWHHTRFRKLHKGRMKRAKQDYNIQAVANAFRVLQEFKRDQPEWGISDLGRNLALHKNAVFRILATLEAMGYVEQNPEKETYRLSVQCLELGRAFLRHTSLTHASMGRLESLRDQVGESCYLGILAEEEVLYLEGAQSDHVLHVASRVGKRLPVYCT